MNRSNSRDRKSRDRNRDRSRSIDRTERAARARSKREWIKVDDVTHGHFENLKKDYNKLERDFDYQVRKNERAKRDMLDKEATVIEKDQIIGKLKKKINEKERKENEEIRKLKRQVENLNIQITDVPVVRLDIYEGLKKDLKKQKEIATKASDAEDRIRSRIINLEKEGNKKDDQIIKLKTNEKTMNEELKKKDEQAVVKSQQLKDKEEEVEKLEGKLFKARSGLLKAKKEAQCRESCKMMMKAYNAYSMAVSKVAMDFQDEELINYDRSLYDIYEVVEVDDRVKDGQIYRQARVSRSMSAHNLNRIEKGKMPIIRNEPLPDISKVKKDTKNTDDSVVERKVGDSKPFDIEPATDVSSKKGNKEDNNGTDKADDSLLNGNESGLMGISIDVTDDDM